MPDLNDLLHRTAESVHVPAPDTRAIAAQGRARRTRRRAGVAAAALGVVAVLGIGGYAVNALGDDGKADSHVANRKDESSEALVAYRMYGSWAVDRTVTVGTARFQLDATVTHLAQTSVGVLASQAGSGGPSVLLEPDGDQHSLSIPSDALMVSGDPNEPRVAWLEPMVNEGVVHVWDVVEDEELTAVTVALPGEIPEGGKSGIQEVQLDGDVAYVGTDQRTAQRINWRTGKIQQLPFSPVDVHNGVGISMDDDGRWSVVDTATGEVLRDLGRRVSTAILAPDGGYALVVRFDDDSSTARIEPIIDEPSVELPGITGLSSWTPNGDVIGQVDDDTGTLRRCDTAGDCTDTPIDGLDEEHPAVLPADFLNVS